MNLVPIADLHVCLSPRHLRQHASGAGNKSLQLARAGDVVGVYVGVEQQRQLEAHLGRHLRVPLRRKVYRVDYYCLMRVMFQDMLV